MLACLWIGGGLGLGACEGAQAAPSVEPPAIHLELRPRVCSVAAPASACEVRIDVRWWSAQDHHACIYLGSELEPRQCWEHEHDARFSTQVTLRSDMLVEVRDSGATAAIARETLHFVREEPEYRRRRRSPWSLFE